MAKKPDPNNPSSTFYWKDWENDEALRVSSLAAQGLWMRLLCIAAKAEPYGYVVINGNPIGVSGVARLSGATESEAGDLLAELERNGVFSKDRKGRIFSRRLVREKKRREKAVENGKEGGNPALLASSRKAKENSNQVNPEVNPQVNQQDNHWVKPPYPSSLSPSSSLRSEEVKIGGGGGAREAEKPEPEVLTDPTFREKLLDAMGVDPSGLAGPNGKRIGTQADMIQVRQWQDDLGLSEFEILETIRETMANKRDGPPKSFRFFESPMARLSAAKAAPPPDIPNILPLKSRGKAHENRAFDQAINTLADGFSAGTVHLDNSSRDPFAAR